MVLVSEYWKLLIDIMIRKVSFFVSVLAVVCVIGFRFGVDTVNVEVEKNAVLKPIKSAEEYGPLKIGGRFDPQTNFPYEYPLEMASEANFFIHAVQKDLGLCMFDSCGMSGVLIECMNGWLSGNSHEEVSDEVGLDDKWDDVLAGKASMIVVSDRNSKIVGIYPNSTTHDLPRILRKHPSLTENAKECFDYNMPNI